MFYMFIQTEKRSGEEKLLSNEAIAELKSDLSAFLLTN